MTRNLILFGALTMAAAGCGDKAGCACTEEYFPVCGEDGVTYSNECEAECEGVSYTDGECDSGADDSES